MATFHHRIKSGRKGTARNQAGYIDRRGKYSNRVDLVHRGCGNLPAWSNGDPFVFWRGADRHEPASQKERHASAYAAVKARQAQLYTFGQKAYQFLFLTSP